MDDGRQELSPRLRTLRERFLARHRELGKRLFTEPAEARACAEALLRGYERSVGQPPVLRRAEALREFAVSIPITLDLDALLVGSQAFNPPFGYAPEAQRRLGELGYAATTGHIVHDYGALLAGGVGGLRARLDEVTAQTAKQGSFQQAAGLALEAFSLFIARHAEAAASLAGTLTGARATEWEQRATSLRRLVTGRPATFPEALQLVWFMQVFLHAEQPSVAISFGRFDQYLWPFLEADLGAGRLTLDEAFDWVCAFCLKCCEGDESQNLVLGGTDRDGADAANPLSVLMLEAMAATGAHQPSLNVRWHPGTAPEFVRVACSVAARGVGQPAFMNDAVVSASLEAVGAAPDDARDYGVVGCYEAVPQGAAYANTVLGGLHLPATLTEFLLSSEGRACSTFADFLEGWFAHLGTVYTTELQRLQGVWDYLAANAPSPFGSLLMRGCCERLQALEAGGADYSFVGINLLGLGTAVDSLHCLREVVFSEAAFSLDAIADAVAGDFPEEALRLRLLHRPDRYGSDSSATNELVVVVSTRVAQMVLDSRLTGGARPYPGFFRFSADIYDRRVATPDGRRSTDLVSYGCGPAAVVPTAPTAVLRAASHVAHDRCACGNPLMVTLPAPLGSPEQVADALRHLLITYFDLGGFLVYFHAVTADELRAAQADPGQHADLLVRVSGFSARFVTLDATWQQALIARAEQGL